MGKKILIIFCFIALFQLSLFSNIGKIIYVNSSAGGNNDGSSWSNAFTCLQDALDAAISGQRIWVAGGTYYPSDTHDIGSGFSYTHFRMKNSVAVYGGFVGTEPPKFNLDKRNFTENETILNGRRLIGAPLHRFYYSYHVLYHPESLQLDSSAVLDGFTIRNGRANGDDEHSYGGGIYIHGGSPTLRNLVFENNRADEHGGGLYVKEGAPHLVNVTFSENSSDNGGGGMALYESESELNNVVFINNNTSSSMETGGGGLMTLQNSNAVLTDVEFIENMAGTDNEDPGYGGGMFNKDSSPLLNRVTFYNNTAVFHNTIGGYGGGLYNRNGNPELYDVEFTENYSGLAGGGMHSGCAFNTVEPRLVNVSFRGNSAEYNGGGMYNLQSDAVLINTLFSGNAALQWDGGGLYNDFSNLELLNVTISGNRGRDGGGVYNKNSGPINRNCILWGNHAENLGDEIYNDQDSLPGFFDSIVPYYGGSNFYDDPEFIDPVNAEDAPFTSGNYGLSLGSPAIDYGNNLQFGPGGIGHGVEVDLAGLPRIVNWDIDLGAYECMQVFYLRFNLIPEEGKWSYDGGENWVDSGEYYTLLMVDHTITFSDVEGWNSPADILVSKLNPLPVPFINNSYNVEYDRHTGNLTVNIEPQEAVDAGAQWSIDDGNTWHNAGSALEIEIGTYTVIFKDIDYWNIPDAEEVTISQDTVMTITGEYDYVGFLGEGTPENPFRIETPEQLDNVRNHMDAHFRQVANIDLEEYLPEEGWNPIGYYTSLSNNEPFTGSYDGDGYTISNLNIEREQESYVGLFSYLRFADIHDLVLESVRVRGNDFTGSLAGYVINSDITDCSAQGVVYGNQNVGGLTGSIGGTTIIMHSSFTGKLSASASNSGGLVGRSTGDSVLISNTHANAAVSGSNNVGGLIGLQRGIVRDSYASGVISADKSPGGLIGFTRGIIENSYYNYEDVIINGQRGIITAGAINDELFNAWLNQNLELNIDDYLVFNEDHYIIDSVEDFLYLLAFGYDNDLSFSLTNDLDMSDFSGYYIPYFSADINGNGFTISHLHLDLPDISSVGLFGYTLEANIENLTLKNVLVRGDYYTGGLAGRNHATAVTRCSVMGRVYGADFTGGLIGYNNTDGDIQHCKAVVQVFGGDYVGGAVGYSIENSIIESYTTGKVTGETHVGGLAGQVRFGGIDSCFSVSDVEGSNYIGGLAGTQEDGMIIDSYAAGIVEGVGFTGGLIGSNDEGTIQYSYYDFEASGQDDVGKGEPQSSEDMKKQTTFDEWDFIETWSIIEDVTYPYLQWVITDEEYAAEIYAYEIPSGLYVNQADEMAITVRNTGTRNWLKDGIVYLGAFGDHDDIAPDNYFRVALEHNVLPGQLHTFTIEAYPVQAGVFLTEWQMLKEGEFWFGEICRQNVEVHVRTDVDRTLWELFQ